MSVDYTKAYRLDKNFKQFNRDDKTLYIDYENVNWFRTNLSGQSILNSCDGTRTMDEIIEEQAKAFGFSAEALKISFSSFIEEAINSGIIFYDGIKETISKDSVLDTDTNKINDLWIHVSGTCNLNCPFCYSESNAGNTYQLDYHKVIDFVGGIKDEDKGSIVISGGEPFLYHDLIPLVQELSEIGYQKILIISNGTVGSEKYGEAAKYVEGIQVSVDGTSAEIHDNTRGPGSFDKMLQNIERIKKSGVKKIIISFTPTQTNIKDLPNLPKFAYDHDIDAIHITRLMPVGRGKNIDNELKIDSELYSEYFAKFINNLNTVQKIITIDNELNKTTRNQIDISFAGDHTNKVAYRYKKYTCGVGLGSLSINYDGKIYPCASLQNTKFVLGSIDDNVNDVIKNAVAFMQDVSVLRLPKCKDCEMKFMCGGGCRACAYACSESEDIYALDPMCERYKKEMFEALWHLDKPRVGQGYVSENPIA